MSSGPVTFARYAYPPNGLGFCGPEDSAGVRGYADAGVDDGGLAAMARQFSGAWPYLELIAGANGIPDPLDAAVVEAYWVGNALLDRVPGRLFAAHLEQRFADRVGGALTDLATVAVMGGRPHHNFHVFAVYPWIGMLRSGIVAEPLRVMDSCRIRWGTVLAVLPGRVEVQSRPLVWDGFTLGLGPPSVGTFAASRPVRVGEVVSLHWGWVCEVLEPYQARALRQNTLAILRLLRAKGPACTGLATMAGHGWTA